MIRSDRERSRHPLSATLGRLALITLAVLTVASLAPGAPKDKDQDGNYYPSELTQVYQHTYDEVFQACQDAIERKGWFVTEKDKDKGTISGHDNGGYFGPFIFSMHIESLNSKPETRVTINGHWTKKGRMFVKMEPITQGKEKDLASELQKVLATYH